MNSNYSAVVVKITNLTKHPNADKLQLTNIHGNVVIVGLDTEIGDYGIYFPVETQLSVEYAKANDLIRRKDESGKMAGGFLEENRRIRAIKLRGTPSNGLLMPLKSIDFTGGLSKPEGPMIGFEFTEMNGVPICQKYVPKTNVAGTGKQKKGRKARESKIIADQFRFHFDTAQLGRNIHKINPEDQVVITWKMHGTSAIVSNCLVKKDLGVFARFLSKFLPIVSTEYQYIYASRRVFKNEFAEAKQHFYGEDLWTDLGKAYFEGKLRTGETVYYEIVGYTPGGGAIQGNFDYGCDPAGVLSPQNKVYVYRITMTAPDGSVTELQWNQVKERSLQLGVETVPEIFYGKGETLISDQRGVMLDLAALPEGMDLEEVIRTMQATGVTLANGNTVKIDLKHHWNENFLAYLQMRYVYDQDSQFCVNKVPEEGICVRKEGSIIEVFKLKSFRFLEGETKALDSGEVDTETSQSENLA